MFNLTPYRKHNEISYYDPFQMMEEMERRFWGGNTLASFKTDIRDKGDSYLLEAELPGFQKEDIDIQLSDNNLTISAEHKTESEEKDQKGNFVRRERTWGSYSRSFDVSDIDTTRIKAAYQKRDSDLDPAQADGNRTQQPYRRHRMIPSRRPAGRRYTEGEPAQHAGSPLFCNSPRPAPPARRNRNRAEAPGQRGV